MAVASIGLSGIQSRVAAIQSQLGIRRSTEALPDLEPPPLADFQPFGDVYQAALGQTTSGVPTPGGMAGAYELGAPTTGTGAGGVPGVPGTVGAVGAVAGPTEWTTLAMRQAVDRALGLTAVSGTPAGPGLAGPSSSPGVSGSLAATPTGASVDRIGGYGKLQPPAELAGYGNGQIPAAALEPIGQGGHRLHAPAAAAWRAAVDAAAAEGIELRITDSYRSYENQVDLVRRKGLYSQGGYGATPGTSNHGWGLAVDADVTDARTLDWLRANGWRFGFVEAVPREPWHWEFRPSQA